MSRRPLVAERRVWRGYDRIDVSRAAVSFLKWQQGDALLQNASDRNIVVTDAIVEDLSDFKPWHESFDI
jgi:hypothetical protein